MHHEVIWLYDIDQTRPRRQDTSAMQAARAQTWAKTAAKWACEHCGAKPENFGELVHWWIKPGVCEECGEMLKKQAQADRLEAKFDRDRKAACKWAHDLMRRQDWAIVDTETSGIRGIVLDLAAIAPDGRELFNSLVHADGATIEPGARAVHQITDQELEQAPKLPEIWPAFQRSLEHCTTIVAYNSTFDQARIDQSARRYSLPALAQEWQCAMLEYARYYGDWNSYYGSYCWQKLPGAGHRAIADARATLELIKRMAAEHQEAAARSKPSNE
ncbi:MAG TPA: 3'-5' exonuclease [Ktedonobacteraceae bacterium]|nr:3'-5' exonuclease [Ktedonobacteraceae bacterium]